MTSFHIVMMIIALAAVFQTLPKEGETVLHYRCGTKKGDLVVKVVPNLDIEAMNQKAELADGKIKYSVTLKNKSKNDFIIEGFNIGGSIGSTSFLSLPWAAQEVILRAGETGTVTFLSEMGPHQITANDIAAHAILPPSLYVKYEDAYLLISLKDFSSYGIQYSISYYGAMSLEQYLKRNDDAEDDDNSGDISDNDSNGNQGESRKIVIKSVKASAKKQIKVKWDKIAGASGYQVQYALDKKFVKKSSTKNYKETAGIIKNLKEGTKYFIRIRYYKKIDGKRVYSKWSKIKSCRTK